MLPRNSAIYKDGVNPSCDLFRLFEGSPVGNQSRVEDDDIREKLGIVDCAESALDLNYGEGSPSELKATHGVTVVWASSARMLYALERAGISEYTMHH